MAGSWSRKDDPLQGQDPWSYSQDGGWGGEDDSAWKGWKEEDRWQEEQKGSWEGGSKPSESWQGSWNQGASAAAENWSGENKNWSGDTWQEESSSAAAASSRGQGGLVGESQATVRLYEGDEDVTAEYLAAQNWEDLDLPKDILDGIYAMGFVKPSRIQAWALPIAKAGSNIIGQARNGSGKTGAFAIAMLMGVNAQEAAPQGLCVCPTRELAVQNFTVVKQLGSYTSMGFLLAVPQERLPRKVDSAIIVGTAGKLQDLIKKRVIPVNRVKVFVLDEADVMVDEDQAQGPQVSQIRSMLPEQLQVLLFSATYPERVENFARKMVPWAKRLKVQKEELTLKTITQTYINVGEDKDQKFERLKDLYGALNIGQSIIFVNTRELGFNLAKWMKMEGHAVSLICGTQKPSGSGEVIDEKLRDTIMKEFREGVSKVLIATDVLSRGIDVPAVTLVVNYELPTEWGRRDTPAYDTYQHRIGRTGRFGLKGVAVNLITEREKPLLDQITEYYQCTMTPISGDVEEVESLLQGLR
mmetsp:Transcript_39063/g.91933  ORF Transcript_39063/g.91933 Transcript_39063/m.91933 type:complete len:527 (+) Transcript_39063:99-1679(+)